jgi:hypothetical protein
LPPGVKDHGVPLGLGRGVDVRLGADDVVVAAVVVRRGAGLVLLAASMIES